MRNVFITLFMVFLLFICFTITPIKADEYDDLSKQINDLNSSLTSSKQATQNNEQTLTTLTKQLNSIKSKVFALETEITRKEKEVKDGEEALNYQKTILQQRTISYYKNINKNSTSFATILLSANLSDSLQTFFYQKTLLDEDRKTILQVVAYIKNLEDKKNSLEKENTRMSSIKVEVDKQSQFMASEVSKSKKYESELQNKIASLSVRQQQIVAQKLAALNLPHSAGSSAASCSDDREVDPGFSPRYAFFTFGVPNRVGLNQYGAKGRAEAGQNAEQILDAYYTNYQLNKSYDTNVMINVQGNNEYGQDMNVQWNIEDYVKHIYEMPSSWSKEALKAQVVAARSYALAFTNNGQSSICATQSCQVVKREENSDAWKQAVDETRGWVMITEGKPMKAWFSSTHGGYIFTTASIGWSGSSWTKNGLDAVGSVNSFDDLKNNAYDKASPYFYCDWGGRPQYNKTAWLKPEEVADIANTLSLAKRDGSVISHLSQPDKPNPDGTDTWDAGKVKDELRNRGGNPFNSVSNVSVDWDKGSGRSTSVHISGDAGDVTFDPGEFKSYFNVRAPANIQIVGSLFTAEKK